MSKLRAVHHGIGRLKRRRASVRVGSALAWALSVLLWVLAGAFVLDVLLRMGLLERGIALTAVAAVAAWLLVKHVGPALLRREDPIELALMVERQQGLTTDLVAALQFNETRRAQYGSYQLREAVVDCMDDASGELDFLEGFDRRQLGRRGLVLAVTAVLVVGPALVFPAYAGAFASRLMLGSAHYPTATRIEQIGAPGPRAAYGRPVEFRIRAAGKLPASGTVKVEALGSGLTTELNLAPSPDDPAMYTASLPRALDDMEYTVRLGDAYTEPRRVELIPLPMVVLDLQTTPPAYAVGKVDPAGSPTRRVVLAGSNVVPVITADKPLQSATITIDQQNYPLTRRGDAFVMDGPASPLGKVDQRVRMSVNVVDADGLSLPEPLQASIQVRSDLPPRIAAASASRHVVPTATPRIRFTAVDEFGLDRVEAVVTVVHPDGRRVDSTLPVVAPRGAVAELTDWMTLELADFDLDKGSRLSVLLRAVDHRGDQDGAIAYSDAVVFQVTDVAGLLNAMNELDAQMVEKLDEIIRVQLGIGG